MKQVACQLGIGGSVLLWCLVASSTARAQISSDGTLPTQVEQSGNVIEINGGETAGGNLFHSFREFSIPNGNEAFFNNNANIANIISRVTGGSISKIDGFIRANGNANLILINPSGIQFGPNARLNIGGSFLGTTANSLEFADGTLFNATDTQTPLLTVSVPVGLQFGQNPGAIALTGSGHALTVTNPIFSPVTRNRSSTGLQVRSGKTLALVGGNLLLNGGTLTAEGGRIELGSVAEGSVSLNSFARGWTLG
ncbi:MAG: filamentous hemagglutinin N-terminal domain-containing protein [Hydrococcus sp. RM1_1_31]|nr:filamentous hemagglutinin N-terminal domain-containing protein [Hydrococcus sp. RM1_1_31]